MSAFRGTAGAGGGIKIDLDCFSGVPGLYAAGDITRVGPHGTYSLGGIHMGYSAVSGDLAGRRAAEFLIQDGTGKPLNRKHAKELLKNTLLPVRIEQGVSPDEAVHQLQKAIISIEVCFLKSRRSINEAMGKVANVKEDLLPRLKAKDAHELVKAIECRSMVPIAQMMLIASLAREESRGFHFREEFPFTDNKDWLKLVVLKKRGDGEYEVRTEPVDTPYVKPKEERTLPRGIRLDA